MKNAMNIPRILWAVLLLTCWTGLQAQYSVGSTESQINTTTADRQSRPVAAQAGNGSGIITWECASLDGDGFGIAAQRLSAPATLSGSEIQINATATGHQRFPAVAMDDSGRHVVAWMDSEGAGDGWNIFTRVFAADGTALTTGGEASSNASGMHRLPAVAMDHSGDHVVVWMSDNSDGDGFGIVARTFDNTGSATSSNIAVNDSTLGYQGHPAVAMDSAGNFVVVWQSFGYDGDGNGISAKVYDASGNISVAEFQVNTTTAGNQQEPSVGMDAAGNMLITWSAWDATNNRYEIVGRRFALNGTAQSGEFSVSSSAVAHDHSHVSMSREGTAFVSFSSYGNDGSFQGVYLQGYDASGAAEGSELAVNTTTDDFQHLSGAGWRRDSLQAIIAWQSGLDNTANTQDSDGYGIFSKIVSRADIVPPTALCQDLTVDLDATGNATITAADVDNGSTDDTGLALLAIDNGSFDCATTGVSVVTLTATDMAGNFSTCTSNVTVQDVTAPTVACQNASLSLDATGNAFLTVADVNAGSSDNCSVTTSISKIDFVCSDVGTHNVVLTGSDPSGNTSTCTAVVTVEDNIAPVVSCQSATVALSSTGTASITANDILDAQSDNCTLASLTASQTTFDCSDIGTVGVVLTATDASGNSSSCTANVTVVDNEAPTAVCQNVVLPLDPSGNVTLSANDVDAGSSDNCSVTTSISQTSFGCNDIGSHTVVLTATDPSGNSSTCTSTVVIEDNEAPAIVCQSATVALNSSGFVTISAADIVANSTDNCGIASTVLSQENFDCGEVGIVDVTVTTTDLSGNVSSCVASVTVEDNEAPVVNCQSTSVTLNASGSASITAGDIAAGFSDNCGIASLVLSQENFACSDVGTVNVTLTVTDMNGLTASCTGNVTVIDNTAPVVTCMNANVVLNVSGSASISAANVAQSSSDNCGSPSLNVNQTNFDCSDIGSQAVTVTATDASGNTGTCTATVTVSDNTAPTLNCPSNTSYSCIANIPAPSPGLASVSDNCDSNPLVLVQDATASGSCSSGTYIRNRTFTATDNNGNSSSCTQTISVNVPTKIVLGDCIFCIAKVKVFPNCSNPSQVRVTSCQKMTKITLKDENGSAYNYSVSTKDKTITLPNNRIVKKVWVKSGCSGTNGNGFTHTFNLCNGSSKFDEDFGPSASDLARVSMEAFPNPTTGRINVQLSNSDASKNGIFEVKVVDMQGRTLIVRDVTLEGGYQEIELDLDGLSNGLYYLVADGEDQRLTEKIVKQ